MELEGLQMELEGLDDWVNCRERLDSLLLLNAKSRLEDEIEAARYQFPEVRYWREPA